MILINENNLDIILTAINLFILFLILMEGIIDNKLLLIWSLGLNDFFLGLIVYYKFFEEKV